LRFNVAQCGNPRIWEMLRRASISSFEEGKLDEISVGIRPLQPDLAT